MFDTVIYDERNHSLIIDVNSVASKEAETKDDYIIPALEAVKLTKAVLEEKKKLHHLKVEEITNKYAKKLKEAIFASINKGTYLCKFKTHNFKDFPYLKEYLENIGYTVRTEGCFMTISWYSKSEPVEPEF